ncbi:hypothetical protein KR009_009961 [Drosophila setifemur]|nr:hypothetical protein KR009_009961 [Drosophila setifemur]
MASDNVQVTFDRLVQLPGVNGAILLDPNGLPMRSSLAQATTQVYANKLNPLVTMARKLVHDLDPADELSYVRLRTRQQELMVASENSHTIIVIQDLQALDQSRRDSSRSQRNSATTN